MTLLGAGGVRNRLWQLYTYDKLGRLTKQEQKTTDASGTSLTAPQLIAEYLYDNYNSSFSNLDFTPVAGVVAASDMDSRVRGLKTHERLAVLEGAAGTLPSRYVTRTFYYDSKGRVIQMAEQNSDGLISRTSVRYDFVGNVLISHEQCGGDVKQTDFNYDHRSRLLSESTTINNSASVSINYGYDELGRHATKTTSGGITEKITYNIRGWMTSKSVKNFEAEELFHMDLSYDTPTHTGSTPSYTGNISEWSWRYGAGGDENTYAFNYDNLSRLVGTTEYLNGQPYDRFLETGMLYDKNGNLTSIIRSVDDLFEHYTYKYIGNQLSSITTQQIFPDSPNFHPNPIETSSFRYDSRGNLVYDAENYLTISYNALNLIQKVERNGSTLANYTYLSDGTKVSAVNGDGIGYAYMGSLVYNKNGDEQTLESTSFSGGRIVATDSGYEPRYFITDHLGSTRVVVNDAGAMLERNNYFPFGLRWPEDYSAYSGNRYLYNGKEEQSFVSLPYTDYGARMYNGTRWFNMDPLAEQYPSISPDAYCAGNPVRFIDPNGMEFTESAWEWVNKLIEEVNSKQASNNKKIEEKQAELNAGGVSDGKANRLTRRINRLTASNASLESVRAETATLAASDQVYDVKIDNSLNTSDMSVGALDFNFSNGNVEIRMPSNGGVELFAHELRHAYQFENGEVSVGPALPRDANGYTNFLYDQHDEVDAYARGALFGQTAYSINSLPPNYKKYPVGPVDVATHPGLQFVKSLAPTERDAAYRQVAAGTWHAFRVNGQTYYRPR